jgi:hypothetical protein
MRSMRHPDYKYRPMSPKAIANKRKASVLRIYGPKIRPAMIKWLVKKIKATRKVIKALKRSKTVNVRSIEALLREQARLKAMQQFYDFIMAHPGR